LKNIISNFMNKLKLEDINSFANNKGINLNDNELLFTYEFIKKNWSSILGNPKLFNIDRYKSNYTADNFIKIKRVYKEYLNKYSNYL
jgi:hypothetical protein